MPESAVGLGFDVHPFAAGGELWLGGLLFEGEVGLSGHSDGDVVCHAVADALLGAVAMGDIGEHFPETAPETAGIAGEELALGQTPQAFRTSVLREAHAKADVAGASFTDDATMLRWAGFEVRAISGDPANVKITTIADLAHADRRMGGDDG